MGEQVFQRFMRIKTTQWHPNGQLHEIITYSNGRRHGPFVSYDAQGNKTTEGSYESDERAGTWKRYHSDGSVKSIETYDNNTEESALDCA